jgi:hypothetical protein
LVLDCSHKVTTKRGSSSDDEGEDDTSNEISKVRVKLSQGGNVEMLSASKVFLATNITERNKTKYNKKAPQITEADKKRTAKNLEKAEKVVARVKAKTQATKEALRRQAAKPVKEAPPPKAKDTGKTVTLYPVIYNEFLALEGFEDEADSKLLKRFGFTRFAEYAYLPIKTAQAFNADLDYIEDRFTISPKTVAYLDMLADSFQSGKGRKFDVQLAPVAEFPQFYRMRHTVTVIKNKRKPELKLYPVLLNGNLMLVVDLTTNPAGQLPDQVAVSTSQRHSRHATGKANQKPDAGINVTPSNTNTSKPAASNRRQAAFSTPSLARRMVQRPDAVRRPAHRHLANHLLRDGVDEGQLASPARSHQDGLASQRECFLRGVAHA